MPIAISWQAGSGASLFFPKVKSYVPTFSPEDTAAKHNNENNTNKACIAVTSEETWRSDESYVDDSPECPEPRKLFNDGSFTYADG